MLRSNRQFVQLYHVLSHASFRPENFRANITLSALDVTQTVNVKQMPLKGVLVFCYIRTDVTLERLTVTNTMNRRQVLCQVAFLCKLPAANLALVPGVRMLSSAAAAAALRMRRVVVSADWSLNSM